MLGRVIQVQRDVRYLRQPRVSSPTTLPFRRPAAAAATVSIPSLHGPLSHGLSQPHLLAAPTATPPSCCCRWVLTDCAAHPEARCVATQATHRVRTHLSRHMWLSPRLGLWLRVPKAHRTVGLTHPKPALRFGLRSVALT